MVDKCSYLDVDVSMKSAYNFLVNSRPKGANIMEPTALTQLEFLRDTVRTLVAECTDESLLDLIAKLLSFPSEG